MGTSMSWKWQYEPESYYFSIYNTCLDLDHMLSFIEPLQSFALSKLEQRDLKKRKQLKPVGNMASFFHGQWQWYQNQLVIWHQLSMGKIFTVQYINGIRLPLATLKLDFHS